MKNTLSKVSANLCVRTIYFTKRGPRFYFFHLVTVIYALFAPCAAHSEGDVFDQFYRYVEVKNKSFEPHLPGERVDHFTGTLSIVQEDMSFPGKAGLDLRIIRTYSSKIWGRSDLIDPEPALALKDESSVGYGWTLHMGRLRYPDATGQPQACGAGDYPVYESPDGTARTFYPLPNSHTEYISRDYWKLSTNCQTQTGSSGACITTSSGQKLEFEPVSQYSLGLILVWPLSRVTDVFNNQIEVTYVPNGKGRIDQVTDTWERKVQFNYGNANNTCATNNCLESIVASDQNGGGSRQVTYSYKTTGNKPENYGQGKFVLNSPGRAFLTGVQPAIGPGYGYTYAEADKVENNQYALSTISYPFGGKTTYTYFSRKFFTGREMTPFAVVATRTTEGPSMPTATWSYDYSAPEDKDFQTTTITRPDGYKDAHDFYGFGYAARQNATGYVWKVGLEAKVSRANGAEVETMEWDKEKLPLTHANYQAPAYGASCPKPIWDEDIFLPVLTSRIVTRDGSRYKWEAPLLDASGRTNFEHGQPRKTIETGEVQREKLYEYDVDEPSNQVVGRVIHERVCEGSSAANCFTVTRTFNGPNRQLDSETRGDGGSATTPKNTTKFGYHTDGSLKFVTNALGQNLTLEDYDAGIPTKIDYNGAFTITREVYWDGNLKSETNGRGDKTVYTYDAAGRLYTITPPRSDLKQYIYSPMGDYLTVERGVGTKKYSETTKYDGIGRVIETSNSLSEKQTREYDQLGRLIFKSYPYASGAREVGDKTEYDALGRPSYIYRRYVATGHLPLSGRCSDPAGCKTTLNYLQDHCRKATVERGRGDSTTATTCFESFSDISEERLVKLTDANAKIWKYSYDVLGNLKDFIAPQIGGNRSFTYTPDTFYSKTETSGPRGTTTVLSHNAIGQKEKVQDSRGITTIFKYADAAGHLEPLSRLVYTQYGEAASRNSSDDVTRTYEKDLLKTVSSANGGTYTYTYDARDRVWILDWKFRGKSYATTYEYDSAGCLTDMQYPTGSKLKMTCDPKGRTVSVKRVIATTPLVTETIADHVTYHPNGPPSHIAYGNGRSIASQLENGRIKSILTPGVVNLTYTYDGVDNVKSITDTVDPARSIANITYDPLDRLYDVTTTSGVASFRYDDLGNRTEKTEPNGVKETYKYDPNTNRLIRSSSYIGNISLTWSEAGRLVATSDGATFQQDGYGRRIATQFPRLNMDVVYHYDVSGKLLAETRKDGSPIREYYYVADKLVAVDGCIEGFQGGCAEREWYHTDIIGSVVARTDKAGRVSVNMAYHPWGAVTARSGPSGSRLFAGQLVEPSSLAFHDFGQRLYSDQIGRFISTDPVRPDYSTPQTSNLYAYGLNNPYKYTDPNGQIAWIAVTAGIGAVIGGGVAAYAAWDSLNGMDFAAAVAAGAAAGAFIGSGLGEISAVAITGSASASVSEVVGGGVALGASALGIGGKVAADKGGEIVSKGKEAANVALGLGTKLEAFAESTGASTWKEWAQSDPLNWKSAFLRLLGDPSSRAQFNLTGVDNVWTSIARAAAGRGGATDWELLMIRNNPAWWPRVTFWLNDQIVKNPFE